MLFVGRKHEPQVMRLLLVFALLAVLVSSSYGARHLVDVETKAGARIPGMFVFGDSIVDPGNNNNRLTLARANHLPYGNKWKGHEASGRFSDGKLVVDFIAEHLGLPYVPRISMNPSAAVHGMNFGSGSSGILDSTGELLGEVIPLSEQVNTFTKVAKNISHDLIAKSIFYVSSGNNDMISVDSDETILLQLQDQLERLYDLGARKFVVTGILAVGCVPMTAIDNKCTSLGKSMTTKYNTLLQGMLRRMKQLHQDFTFVYANVATIMEEVIADPASAGMTNVHKGCCSEPCFEGASYCSDSSKYLFWDFVHPTQAFNTIVAERWFNGSDPYVTPMNIAMLAAM